MRDAADIAVVGSGITGLSCAKGLIARGMRVTLIDAGEALAADRQAAVDAMRWKDPQHWSRDHLRLITENKTLATHKIPRKLAFGSDYVYGHGRPFSPTNSDAKDISFSFARGGFSNVWGGAILPTAEGDMVDWPIGRDALAPFYEKVLSSLPLSAEQDAIETAFPLYRKNTHPVPLDQRTRQLLADFRRAADMLVPNGILAGMARLAVHAQAAESTPGCNACGLCLTGCPRGAIYSTQPDLDALIRAGALRYLPNRLVTRLTETASGVETVMIDIATGESHTQSFGHVFVGAGPINTTRIVLNSLEAFGTPVFMQESQKFLLPMFGSHGNPRIFDETAFSLPNALLLVRPSPTEGHWSQIQVSPVSDLVLQKLRLDPTRMSRTAKRLLSPIVGHLMFGWGSIHSRFSAKISITLLPDNADRHPTLRLQPVANPAFEQEAKRVARRVLRHARSLRLWPLIPLIRLSPAGVGCHYGGTFPMRQRPKDRLETDILGRLPGWKRIFLIDSTTFPSVPGTTVALLAMANAARIAANAPLE